MAIEEAFFSTLSAYFFGITASSLTLHSTTPLTLPSLLLSYHPGKTWTMSGPPSDRGVNTRALGELFERTQARSSVSRDTITVSLLEVYNEEIRDLLVAGGSTEKLEVRQSDLGNHVPGLTVMAVQDLQDVFDLLTLADSNRSQGK